MGAIAENISAVTKNIQEAARRAGRDPADITLVAVTKTVETSRAAECLDCGCVNLGENRVQELTEKYDILLQYNPIWHMIGHLQTNKVKQVIGKAALIHSADSYKLCEKISQCASARGPGGGQKADILIEVNMGGEDTKAGLAPEGAGRFAAEAAGLPGISIKGLMTVAPYVANPEDVREIFKKMRKLFVDIKQKNYDNIDMKVLSMGMTNDYCVAIEEGATMVRIGTGIFGSR
ncbi:MAG: YggS family pyridoxal phosphate-dependent enzyme [Clostridiales bacterium]|jgi:pyridoxal phosphate enzyme (YggS family)|nr:YggS family pyridoxal phosphate-dependent enzyme [Clostridiales bacterium]